MLFLKYLLLLLLTHNFVSCAQSVEDDRISQIETTMTRMLAQMETMWHEISKLNTNIADKRTGHNSIALNDTDELESRVLILELEMDTVQSQVINLFDDVAELQSQDSLTDLRLTTVEENIEGLVDSDAAFEDRIASLEAAIAAPWIACESSPCDNGATCVDVNVDTFICLCRDGFFGQTCSNSYADTLFLATIGAQQVTPVPEPLVFNETRLDRGGNYDNTTGIYSIPLDGTYQFNVNVFSAPDNDFGAFLVGDGIDIAHCRNADAGGVGWLTAAISVLVHAEAGQQFWVRPHNLDVLYGRVESDRELVSWFAGYLVSAD